MDERAAGYITEVEYDYGIYDQLSPIRARLALLYAGFAPPEVSTACELGFGHGLSLNVHAAAAPTVSCGR